MTDFNQLVPDAKDFLSRLAQNNTRDWFSEHKAEYERHIKGPAQLFLDQIAARLQKRLATPIKTKLFRIHRDVRFSKDKTPYNTHSAPSLDRGRGRASSRLVFRHLAGLHNCRLGLDGVCPGATDDLARAP